MSAVLDFPDILPARASWKLVSNTQVFRSPLSGAIQTVELPGARWHAELTFEKLSHAQARELAAFLVRLRGQAGRFRLHDHTHPQPFGAATGAPVVAGSGQTGTSLNTSGWTPSTPGILQPGDYFSTAGELKMVVATADSDANGNATIVFEPPLRTSPADQATITVDKPTAVMMLDHPEIGWSTRPPIRSNITIACTEDIT